MATSQKPRAIEKEARFMGRLISSLDELGSLFMKKIYNHATGPRNSGEPLEDHIMRTKGLSIEEFEMKFNPEIRNLIAQDPSMDSFDITAWFTLLHHGCSGLAPCNDNAWCIQGTLENNLKCIKDFRNDLVHSSFLISESEFYMKLEKMRALLESTALLAKSKFSLDMSVVNGILNQCHSTINNTRDLPPEVSYFSYLDATPLINFLKEKGKPELKTVLKESSIVNPAFLIGGRYLPMEVAEIYTPLRIVDEGGNAAVTVCLDDILKVANDTGKNIILLEGIAGVGKTTIIKKMISDWTREGGTIKVLNIYDFVIPIQCREQGYTSVGRIVSAMMPSARKKFYEDKHMTTCLLACKTFFILDGIDEITKDSEAVLTEILGMTEKENVTILLTTRPEKIKAIYQLIHLRLSKVLHLRIDGVADINKENFITRYHAKLIDLGVSTQSNSNGLQTYLRTTGARLQEQLTLPLNLTLVTLIWGIDVDRILSITCPIELSIAIRNISLVRLEERVVHSIKYTLDIFEKKLTVFLSLLSEIALFGIRDSELLISQSKFQKLKKRCVMLSLPIDELLGAFLVQKNWLSSDIFTFPHKSAQEFFAATHIYNRFFSLKSGKQKYEDKLKKVHAFLSRRGATIATSQGVAELINEETFKGKTVTEMISEFNRGMANPSSMNIYQGTLTSLLGLLHYYKVLVTEESACEITTLLQASGVTKRRDWIMVLNSVKCDPMMAKTIVGKVGDILREEESISEKNVFSYATLLEHKKPSKVSLVIHKNPSDILRLEELMTLIAYGNVKIDHLDLYYCFRHPKTSAHFRSFLNTFLQKCTIEKQYSGHVPHETGDVVKGLEGVTELIVSLQSPEDVNPLFTFLRRINEPQKALNGLTINVGDVITAEMLQSIPEGALKHINLGSLIIFIPDVTDDQNGRRGHKAVSDIIRTLNPPEYGREIFGLVFPRFQITSSSPQGKETTGEGIKRLLQTLGGCCRVSWCIMFPSRCRPTDEMMDEVLQKEIQRIMQCPVGIRWGGDTKHTLFDIDSWE